MAFWNIISRTAFIHIRQWFLLFLKQRDSCLILPVMSSFWNAVWSRGVPVTESHPDTYEINKMSLILQAGAKSSVQLISFHLNSLYCLWPRSSVGWSATKPSCKSSLLCCRHLMTPRPRSQHGGRSPALLGPSIVFHRAFPLADGFREGRHGCESLSPIWMTRCGGYLSSLGGRALALPRSRPVALSRRPLLEQEAGFHGGPHC